MPRYVLSGSLRHIHITPGALSDRRAWSLVATYSSSLAAVWQQCGNSLAAAMAIYQQRASPPTGEHDLGGMFRDMLCACGTYNLWFKALPIENISGGGGWGEEATYAMDAKRPNCKPTCSTCLNKKHKVSWQFMTTGSARNKQQNTTHEWYLEWFF